MSIINYAKVRKLVLDIYCLQKITTHTDRLKRVDNQPSVYGWQLTTNNSLL